MNFNKFYNKFHDEPIDCENFPDIGQIKNTSVGSGGSDNVVLIVDQNNIKYAVKIIPTLFYPKYKEQPNDDQMEIKFYQFFTKRYILTDRTPHIVGIYKCKTCDNIRDFLLKIKPKKSCPTFEEKLLKKVQYTQFENQLCNLLLYGENKLMDSKFIMALLEYCDFDFSRYLRDLLQNVYQNNFGKNIGEFFYELIRILFQIIFTLAIIQDDYPGFQHSDLFIRNILISVTEKYTDNEYVAYYYKQKIFYLPANGVYAKINDFGTSIIVNELEPNTYIYDKQTNKIYHKNPFNHKNDVYNLLLDIYFAFDEYMIENKLDESKIKSITNFMDKFIDIKTINKIFEINYYQLKDTWYIDGINVLENTIKTPHDYIMSDVFEVFQDIPVNAKIIRHFNSPRL